VDSAAAPPPTELPKPCYADPAEGGGRQPIAPSADDQQIKPQGDGSGSLNASARQATRNVAFGYLQLGVSIVLGLVSVPIFLHSLGPKAYGLWGALVGVVGYASLVEGGMATASNQRMASLLAMGDDRGAERVLASAKCYYLASSAGITVIVAVLAFFVGQIVRLEGIPVGAARLALLLVGASAIVGFFRLPFSSMLFGGGRGDVLSVIGAVAESLGRLATLIVAMAGGGLVGICATGAVSTFGSLWLTRRSARRAFPEIQAPLRLADRVTLVSLLRAGTRVLATAIGGTVSYGLDTVVIGIVDPVAFVTPYIIGGKPLAVVNALATRGTAALGPNLSHFHAVGDTERTFRIFSASTLVALAVTVPFNIALIALGPSLLHLWLGTVPARSDEVLVALAIVYILHVPGGRASQALTFMERNHSIARVIPAVSVVNLGLTVLLTIRYGPVGPALGSLPEVFVINSGVLPVLACRAIGVPVRRLVADVVPPIAAAALAAGAVGFGAERLLAGHSDLLVLFAAPLIALAGWGAGFVVLRRTQPELMAMLRRRLPGRLGKMP